MKFQSDFFCLLLSIVTLSLVSAQAGVNPASCDTVSIVACSHSYSSTVGFFTKLKRNGSPVANLASNKWHLLYDQPNGATVYVHTYDCTYNSETKVCTDQVRVMYGSYFSATFVAMTNNFTFNSSYLEWNKGSEYDNSLNGNFVKIKTKTEVAEISFGDRTELHLSVKEFEKTIDVLLTVRSDTNIANDRTGSTNGACMNNNAQIKSFETTEAMEQDLPVTRVPLDFNYFAPCFAICSTSSDDTIRPFVRKNQQNYVDKRVGWVNLFNASDIRIAVRQNLCQTANALTLCNDKILIANKNDAAYMNRQSNNMTMTSVSSSIRSLNMTCNSEKCDAQINTFRDAQIKIIVNNAGIEGTNMDVIIAVTYNDLWNNTNGACGVMPSSFPVADVVPKSYIRPVNFETKGITIDTLKELVANYPTGGFEKVRSSSPCALSTAPDNQVNTLSLLTNQGYSADSTNLNVVGDKCWVDVSASVNPEFTIPIVDGGQLKVGNNVVPFS